MGKEELLARLKQKFFDESYEDEIVPVAQEIVAQGIDVLEAIQAASEAIRRWAMPMRPASCSSPT